MMKRVLLAASAFVMLCASAAAQDVPVAGGYSGRPTNDAGVRAAARFAVRERGRQAGGRVTLLGIERAETQVVAGLNYRLLLRVRENREESEVLAVVYQNLRRAFSLTSWTPEHVSDPLPPSREVKVFLVALDDKGRRGRKIGCDDSLVPVTRMVARETLRAAVEELLSLPREYEGGLGNYWAGEDLRVQSATLSRGVATIRIKGTLPVAGVCDEPRIEEQIKATARQFRGVRGVRVFLNGRRLADAIR
jgi:hypothetical protein